MVASHAARLAELNVAPEVIAALPECAREPPVVGGVRVMSWNILAEGMSPWHNTCVVVDEVTRLRYVRVQFP